MSMKIQVFPLNMCCTVSFMGEWRIYIDDSFMLGEFVPSLISKTFIYFTSYHLVFLDNLQKLRGIFTDVFRGYSQRPDSVRHEYFS